MSWWPFSLYKAGPADYAIKFVNGTRRTEGTGRTFVVGPRTTIMRVPTTDRLVSFQFTELTSDGQEILVQGELQIKLDREAILARKDFSVDPHTNLYLSDDPRRVEDEARAALQAFVRRDVATRDLRSNLTARADLESEVRQEVEEQSGIFTDLGFTVVTLFVSDVRPSNRDLTRALEAEARERMLADADKAVADRRKDAARNERALKEYEAETALHMERERANLVTARNENRLAEAEANAEATRRELAPFKDVDGITLFALGIREGKVREITVTPEVLAGLARRPNGAPARR